MWLDPHSFPPRAEIPEGSTARSRGSAARRKRQSAGGTPGSSGQLRPWDLLLRCVPSGTVHTFSLRTSCHALPRLPPRGPPREGGAACGVNCHNPRRIKFFRRPSLRRRANLALLRIEIPVGAHWNGTWNTGPPARPFRQASRDEVGRWAGNATPVDMRSSARVGDPMCRPRGARWASTSLSWHLQFHLHFFPTTQAHDPRIGAARSQRGREGYLRPTRGPATVPAEHSH
jgi:hypothetical protein